MNNAINSPVLVVSSTSNAASMPKLNYLAYHQSNNSRSASIDGSSKRDLTKTTEPLNLFFPMFPFVPPENIRKPSVF